MNQELISLLEGAAIDVRPSDQLKHVLEHCASVTKANVARFYSLKLADFSFSLIAAVNHPGALPKFPANFLNRQALSHETIVHRVISTIQPARLSVMSTDAQRFLTSPKVQSRMLTPVRRSRPCIALIDLESDEPDHFTLEHQEFACAAASIAVHLLEKDDILALFEALPEPIDYRLPLEKFQKELMALTASASRMPYIALRELNQEKTELRCIGTFGFGDVDIDKLDLIPLTDHPTFLDVISTGKPRVEKSMSASHLSTLRGIDFINNVKSFVAVPIKVGSQIFGTLSFGAPCDYDYTRIEQSAFETIANSIGVSIANWRNFHNSEVNLFNEAKTSAAIGVAEVAQSTRHDVKNFIEAASYNLLSIQETAKDSNREDLRSIREYARSISDDLKKMLHSIDNIKVATKPPKLESAWVDLAQLWEESVDMVAGRLAANSISCTIKGKAETLGYPEFLRHAFLHLLYNSIEAFIERKIKRNRKIEITIDAQSESAKSILIRYTDTAGGIDPSKLQPPMPPDTDVANYIFDKEVTSKEGGSGYGMFLARRIIQVHHKGTIELTDHRKGGIVFDIYLPKREKSALKKSKP